ncbi:MAG: cytochrome c family protein [Hyphomicrobiaceae bacterium]
MMEAREERGGKIPPTGDVDAPNASGLHPSRALNADPLEPKASPLRWLFVIIPLIVIALAGAFVVRSVLKRPVPAIELSETDRQSRPTRLAQPKRADPPAVPGRTERTPTSSAVPPVPWFPDTAPEQPTSNATERRASEQWEFNAGEVLTHLARADLKNGAAVFKICAICHSAEATAGHRLGPNLWNMVGRRKASYDDYAYSQALRLRGGRWTYEELAVYLYDTRTAVPGGKMAFAGIKNPAKLADVIAFLRTLADTPEPLPPTP